MADGAITLDSLLDAIEKKEPFPMVKRPGLGRNGRKIKITTNLFRVGCSKLTRKLFQYDVRFTIEDKPREDLFALKKHRELRVQIYKAFIEGKWQDAFGEEVIPAWDGNKQLLTSKQVELGTDENGEELYEKVFNVEVRSSEEREGGLKRTSRTYVVAIKLAKELPSDMLSGLLDGNFNSVRDPREIMQALDIIMSYRLPPRYLVHGRNFYDPLGARPAGGGSQILSGFFQSLRPATQRLYMNFDITAGLFVQSVDVTELLLQLLNLRRVEEIANYQAEGIRRALRPFLLNNKHRQRGAFKAKAVTQEFAADLKFEFDGARISVAEYFEKEKRIKLKYPKLQCIELKHSRGSETFVEYLPLELCTIVGGRRWAGKTTQSHVDQIRKMIASKPPERSNKIVDSVRRTADFSHEAGGIINDHKRRVLAHFGLSLAAEAAVLEEARILEVPMIDFKDKFSDSSRSVRPQSGAWNVRDARLLEGRDVRNWAIFIFASRFNERDADKFGNAMAGSYKNKTGASMSGRPFILTRRGTGERGSIKEMFDEVTERLGSKIDVIFCIIDEKDSLTYHEVKRCSELEYGYITQCVKDNRARECKPPVLENIILKLNAKLGCRNCDISAVHNTLIKTPTLVLGGDISHGGAGSNSPSVCALVGNTDRYMQQLSASLSVQELKGGSGDEAGRLVRQEEIVDMKRMTKERVDEFVKGCKRAPKAILYYRDGVADSQFESVITKELVEIRDAIRELKKDHPDWWKGDDKDPVKITAIIHQKRHHVRFFPGQGCPTDRSGNCAPGTVVDTKIGHPYGYDFFLISHAGIQGCSRPSYYRVILDENDYGPDWLQEVTFVMCHLYASCTRSISGVPVCFYADRLAMRVRDYLYENVDSDAGSVMSGNSGRGGRGDEQRGGGREGRYKVAPLHKNLKDKMFFA